MLISAKLAPCFPYPEIERFWKSADELGFHAVWNYDHFYGLTDPTQDTLEGWTSLAAMAVVVRRARVGCMVTGVTYRHPAILAKMAVTIDHISGGRLDFGFGAAWHEGEHRGYGIPFPPARERIAMLDEALSVIKAMWTQEAVSLDGRFFRLNEARCHPKPLQKPHPPIVVGGSGPKKTLRVVARHADEWNAPGHDLDPPAWAKLNSVLDEHCQEVGRDPKEIRRSVQLFLFPFQEGQADRQLESIAEFGEAGCEHVVLSFYAPPSPDLMERAASYAGGG